MTFLLDVEAVFPKLQANIAKDYALLGISKLQARVYESFYGLSSIPVAEKKGLKIC